jgi:hypothetical protein
MAVIGLLAGSLLTGCTLYVTIASQFVTRVQVSEMIAKESPYVPDRKWIEEKFTALGEAVREVDRKVDLLVDGMPVE